jgi:hypothetical protein
MARLIDLYDSGFDPNALEASAPREQLPEDDYLLAVEKTELVPNRSNTGMRLDVTFTVVSGLFEGRKLFVSYNVQNQNEQARQIALREFKALIDATGVDPNAAFEDTDVLLYKPFLGHVTLKQDTVKDGFGQRVVKLNPETGQPYPPRNAISSYKSADSLSWAGDHCGSAGSVCRAPRGPARRWSPGCSAGWQPLRPPLINRRGLRPPSPTQMEKQMADKDPNYGNPTWHLFIAAAITWAVSGCLQKKRFQ